MQQQFFGFPPHFLIEFRRFFTNAGSSSAYPSGLGSRAHHSVFLLSSHWVRRFFIDQYLSFFLLGIDQEVFSTYT